MDSALHKYCELIARYLAGEISAPVFQADYFAMFKGETSHLNAESFRHLDRLFGDLDAFVADPALLDELRGQMPDFYLDEAGLRERVAATYEQLCAS